MYSLANSLFLPWEQKVREHRLVMNVILLVVSPCGMEDKCYSQAWSALDLSRELQRILKSHLNKFGKQYVSIRKKKERFRYKKVQNTFRVNKAHLLWYNHAFQNFVLAQCLAHNGAKENLGVFIWIFIILIVYNRKLVLKVLTTYITSKWWNSKVKSIPGASTP